MKSYIKPETQIVEIENNAIMAASLPVNSGKTTDTQLVGRERGGSWSDYEN
ncbi:MAG: hypothetical protein IJP70_10040 [Bacteroidales bacterium]|nr:hypothetical protein [Bacteroidales bacterium]